MRAVCSAYQREVGTSREKHINQKSGFCFRDPNCSTAQDFISPVHVQLTGDLKQSHAIRSALLITT